MARKITDGDIRNKERTKLKLLDAVAEIIQTEGYTKLGINHIAQVAGVHKKLIYRYFGSVNDLIESYVRIKDYWLGLRYEADGILKAGKEDCGRAVAPNILENLMTYLNDSPEMQKIILWEISEESKLMQEIVNIREQLGSELFKLTDPLFEQSTVDLRGIYAVLTAGVYYLVLHNNSCGGTFCEVDLSEEQGNVRIVQAIHQLLDLAYSEAERQKEKISA